ncbi:MAG: DUF951 family protein [Anaerolineae bacterium]|nr:DUF951 family protein [Anaerolineae bacterium]
MIPDVQVGDVVRMRKIHPCGSYEWRVVRIGVDIGLVCLGCQRRVLIPRSTFNKRVKTLTHSADSGQ